MATSEDPNGLSCLIDRVRQRSGEDFAALSDEELLGCLTHSSVLNESPTAQVLCFDYLGGVGRSITETWWVLLFASQRRAVDIHAFQKALLESGIMEQTLDRLSGSCGLTPEDFVLGKGASESDERETFSVTAAGALVGRLFQKAGWGGVVRPLTRVKPDLDAFLQSPQQVNDPKSLLQELAQARVGHAPAYATVVEPDAQAVPSFQAMASVAGDVVGWGRGRRKKEAEVAAALSALTSADSPWQVPRSRIEQPIVAFIEVHSKGAGAPEPYCRLLRTALEGNGLEDCDEDRFIEAFTDASWINEHPHPRARDNRWLAFLGGRVWDLWCSNRAAAAGTNPRSRGDVRRMLAALRPGVVPQFWPIGLLRMSRGARQAGPTKTIVNKAMNAVVGAMALTAGMDRTMAWLDKNLADETWEILNSPQAVSTSVLQERVQGAGSPGPEYDVREYDSSQGLFFVASVWVEGRLLASGIGNTHREARRVAASIALGLL